MYILKYLSIHEINKGLQDDMLNLFVIIFLKGSLCLQRAVIGDLETIFMLIKEQETSIFVDRKFKYKILFSQLLQLQHCLKESSKKDNPPNLQQPCENIINPVSKKRSFLSSKSAMFVGNRKSDQPPVKTITHKPCVVHNTCDMRSQAIDLTSSKTMFISYICLMA